MATNIAVLIVGAGPCGLAAACQLLRFDVPVRVLEAGTEPTRGSRAIQLWPLALEVLQGVGVLAEADRRGIRVQAMNYHLSGGRRLRSVLGTVNEPLLLPQEQTSDILERALERLGGRVERGVRVIDVDTSTPGTVTVKAQGRDGIELIEADWLIGADGVRSTVRERLGIGFPGVQVATTFLLAEGRFDGYYEPGSVHYYLGPAGSMVVAPLPGGVVRVAGPVPANVALTPETVQELVDARGPGSLRVGSLDMIGTFGSQERIASSLRQGHAFLVGDAAHTHSPLGGQGLNLGLQDVHNLVWKLAGVIHGRYGVAILDSYEIERRRAAEQTVHNTRQFARMFMLGRAAARVRDTAWRTLDATGLLRRWFVPLLAGWRMRYPDTYPAARAGEHAPHWAMEHRAAMMPSEAAGPVGFRLLTTGRSGNRLAQDAAALAAELPALVTHEHVARRGARFLLLRPDGYVAFSGTDGRSLARAGQMLAGLAG